MPNSTAAIYPPHTMAAKTNLIRPKADVIRNITCTEAGSTLPEHNLPTAYLSQSQLINYPVARSFIGYGYERYTTSMPIPSNVLDIDTRDREKSKHLTECHNALAIHHSLLSRESAGMPHSEHIPNGHGTIVTLELRKDVIDHLVLLQITYDLSQASLYLAANIFDRFISTEKLPMRPSALLLVANTCMWISMKYQETKKVPLNVFCFHSGCANTNNLIAMEAHICNTLSFEFSVPTVVPFFERILKALHFTNPGSPQCVSDLAQYALEVALYDYEMLKYKPSLLAASATAFASCYAFLPPYPHWDATMQFHSGGYSLQYMKDCVRDLSQAVCLHSETKSNVKTKYSSSKFRHIALVASQMTRAYKAVDGLLPIGP